MVPEPSPKLWNHLKYLKKVLEPSPKVRNHLEMVLEPFPKAWTISGRFWYIIEFWNQCGEGSGTFSKTLEPSQDGSGTSFAGTFLEPLRTFLNRPEPLRTNRNLPEPTRNRSDLSGWFRAIRSTAELSENNNINRARYISAHYILI